MIPGVYRKYCVERMAKYIRLDPNLVTNEIKKFIEVEVNEEFAANTWKCPG